MKNISVFSVDDIAIEYGFIPRTGKNGISDQIKSIILELHNLKIIELENVNLKPQKLSKCTFLINLNSKFFCLEESHKIKILEYHSVEKIDNIKLLLFYCCLLSRMYKRSKNESGFEVSGGKPEVCYPTYEQISKDTHLSETVIKKYIDILVDLNLIRYDNAGRYYMSKDKHRRTLESANTYALYDEYGSWKNNLKEAIKIYKNLYPDRVFVDDYKNNNKSENGFIARIGQLEKEGKATSEQIEKKNELLAKKQTLDDKDKIKFSIKSLLDNTDYQGMFLSSIYQDKGQKNLSDKYYDIEFKLDIFDKTDNLLISWEQYKWLMINYNEDQHNYYYNCAQKYVRDNYDYLITDTIESIEMYS